MTFLNDIKLALKLPLMLGTVVLMTLIAMGVLGYRTARSALTEAGIEQMVIASDARLIELRAWFRQVESDLRASSANPLTINAIRDFSEAVATLGPESRATIQRLYIDDNPYSDAERYRMTRGGVVNGYTIAHSRYHDGFVAMLKEKGLHDVMLIDPAGNILYTVTKERDLGRNIHTGAGIAPALAGLVDRVTKRPAEGVRFSDFATYRVSGERPVSFAAAAIRNSHNEVLGALVFQISTSQLQSILSSKIGATLQLQSYLVGRDQRLRTDLKAGSDDEALVKARAARVLRTAFSTDRVIGAEPGIFGAPSILVASRLSLPGLDMVLIQEETDEQLLQPVVAYKQTLIVASALSLVLLSAVVFCVARGLARPLERKASTMTAIAAGDYRLPISERARKDEIGMIARALEVFRDKLAAMADLARQGAFRTAAIHASSAALVILDERMRTVFVNPALKRLLSGLPEAADFLARLDGADGEAPLLSDLSCLPADLGQTLAGRAHFPCSIEVSIGETRHWLEFNLVQMEGEGPIGYVVEWREVTVEHMNRAVLGAIDRSLATAEFDVAGRLSKCNGRMAGLLGADLPALTGLGHDRLVQGAEGQVDGKDMVWARLMSGDSVFGRFTLRAPSGDDVILDGGFSPVLDSEGVLLKVLLMGTDVTEAERSLAAADARRIALERAQADVVEALRIGLKHLSEGELTVRIDKAFDDDHETLRSDFNGAVERLGAAVASVIAHSADIASEVRTISASADELSLRSEQQAATIEETAAALDELTVSVQSAATGAAEANRFVVEARASAEASGHVVRDTVEAMSGIEQASERIALIIGVIEDIAFQTNLLALNAGVEAARAGEAGRGFAVVASEVRGLAQRSTDAAREIDGLISDAVAQVKRGTLRVGEAGRALEGIVASVAQIAVRMGEIDNSAQEQSSGLVEINRAVNQIDQATQENSLLFAETAAAGQRLRAAADVLAETAGHFRVRDVQDGRNSAAGPDAPWRDEMSRRAGGERGGSRSAAAPVWPAAQDAQPGAPARPAFAGRHADAAARIAANGSNLDWSEF